MTTSATDVGRGPAARPALAVGAAVSDDALSVELDDGRTVSVPLAWYPRLLHGTPAERGRWRLVGRGEGLHWSELDEDIAVEDLLAGRPSGESSPSLQRWLDGRSQRGAA
jgi:hypothetical protein